MVTPLYKRLKENGTSFYVFPGSSEDISASYQNQNYKMYFSKYALVNFPKVNSVDLGGTQSEYKTFNFGTFSTISPGAPSNFGDQIVESLRNYVANHETTIRGSRLNNTDFYYDPTALETTSEKIFFKWCKKIGLISFEPAIPQDEYFDNLEEFERKNLNDDSYFKEYLWKEREVTEYSVSDIDASSNLTLTVNGTSNLRVGDIVEVYGMESSLSDIIGETPRIRVISVSFDSDDNHVIELDVDTGGGTFVATGTKIKLYYQRFIQYIGEVNGVSNVQQSNKSYTEVYAHVPDHTGKTPDILFRTIADANYKPGLSFPIRPNQYQPEIIGAELFSSPIVNDPLSYPGSYYGQFDTPDFTYETANGDSFRRSGGYYGVSGDINTPIVNGDLVDGISMDFDTSHYVKMNIEDRVISTFDQFNALEVNNKPPQDFEFNAILWYYMVEDSKGNKRTNLYGISFLDNPENNPTVEDIGLKFPIYKKFVTNGSQDGTSYAFAINLNFNIVSDNIIEAYNPDAVNSLFSMNLFNKAMDKLSSANDSFLTIISEYVTLKNEISGMKQLLYSQSDFAAINSRLSSLDNLLKLYSTSQMVSSDTIEVELDDSVSPPVIKHNSIDRSYISTNVYKTSQMFSSSGTVPVYINPPKYKDFFVQIENNDEVEFELDSNLKLVFNSDLEIRQSLDIFISGSEMSSQNKKLDIYITTVNPNSNVIDDGTSTGSSESTNIQPVETLLIGDINLPVFYNLNTSQPNSSKTWKNFNFNIDFNEDIILLPNNTLQISLEGNENIILNSIKQGDALTLNNFFVGTTSVFDFSGQYFVSSISNSQITLDVSINEDFVSYGSGLLPLTLHSASYTQLSNNPFISLNKGSWIRITRISQSDQVPINQKYLIDIRDTQY